MNAKADKQPHPTISSKEKFYFDHIKQWQDSGLGQEQYCKDNGISVKPPYAPQL